MCHKKEESPRVHFLESAFASIPSTELDLGSPQDKDKAVEGNLIKLSSFVNNRRLLRKH